MRIAIDGRTLTGRFTGDRTYWRSLLRALLRVDAENEYLVYTRLPLPEGELPAAPNLTVKTLDAPNERLWAMLALPRALRQDHADVLHVQYTVPVGCPCPVVTAIHDVTFRLRPEWFPRKDRILLNLTIPASIRRAAKVVIGAESAKADLVRVYPFAAEKTVCTRYALPEMFDYPTEATIRDPNAQAQARTFAKERFNLCEPFVLAVSVLQPRKNLPTLLRAFGIMKAKYRLPHQLALTGKIGWGAGREELLEAARAGGGEAAAEAVVFTGYVEDSELPMLYRACAAFAHPALYEGFGFTPLEAMACGAACLVSDAPAMPEIAGEAARIVPAQNPDAWADALHDVLTDADLRQDLVERGLRRARQFSWETTARETLAVYRSVTA